MSKKHSRDFSKMDLPAIEKMQSQLSDNEIEDVLFYLEQERNRQVEKRTHKLRIIAAVSFHLVVIGFLAWYLSFFAMMFLTLFSDVPVDWIKRAAEFSELHTEGRFTSITQTLPYVFLAAALITFINKLGGGVQKRINQAFGNSD